ncbi:MAG: TolC family protein [Peptococcaceae bacterium]|jgi:outer membrane protein TolC|nr:TolC family protein [Peptococcaceae bacterium]MDH7525991.1 TolC family protein [Peptococcaceae bacterium]
MKKKTAFLALFVFVAMLLLSYSLGAVTIDETSVLTLSKAKELALLYSPEVKKQEVAVNLADISRRDAEIAYEQAKAAYINNSMKTSVENARKAYDSAKYALDDSKVTLENLKLKTEYDVEKLYLDILNMDNSIETMKKNYEMQGQLVEIEKLKVQLGLSTNYSLNEKIQQAKDIKRQLDTLYNSREKLAWQMNRMIGREPGALLELAPVTFSPVEIGTQNEANDAAMQTSLTIKQYNRTLEDKSTELEDKKTTQSDKAEKLEFEIKSTKLQKSDAEYNINVALENAYEQMALKQSQLADYRTAYEVEKENYQHQKLKYELGLIGKVTLDSSEISFDQKRTNFEKAVYDYYLSVRQIDLAEKGIIVSG